MKKIIFSIFMMATMVASAQSTLTQRVDLSKDGDFANKLRMAMTSVSIGVLTTPLPEDSLSADSLIAKKEFAKSIIQGRDVDKYIYAVIATGQVTQTTSDLTLFGIISQMFDKFILYKKEQ